jgi:hypothetical protein
MLFAHIIAQKRKKHSKKCSNVKNCLKIYADLNGEESNKNVERGRAV